MKNLKPANKTLWIPVTCKLQASAFERQAL